MKKSAAPRPPDAPASPAPVPKGQHISAVVRYDVKLYLQYRASVERRTESGTIAFILLEAMHNDKQYKR